MANAGSILGTIAGGVGGFMLGGPAGAFAGAGLGAQLGGGSDANQTNIDLQQQALQANQASADKSMQFSADQAEKQKAYETYMSNTSRQRAVADLKAAGLNPLLAGDTGASTPSVSSASGVSQQTAPAHVDNAMAGALTGAIDIYNAANQARKMEADADNAEASVDLTEAQTARTVGGKALDDAQRRGIEAQRARDRATQPLYDAAGNILRRAQDTGARWLQRKQQPTNLPFFGPNDLNQTGFPKGTLP